jgi:segregation and condensation protein B
MPQKLLKAAALIAYHQPMPQSRLVELLGQRAYDHIRSLAQAGLVNRRRDGNTRRLTTTRRFSEVFGCPHTDRKKVKAWFRDMVSQSGMLDGMESKLALRDEDEGPVQTTLFDDESE